MERPLNEGLTPQELEERCQRSEAKGAMEHVIEGRPATTNGDEASGHGMMDNPLFGEVCP
jgi:hypothetical protein